MALVATDNLAEVLLYRHAQITLPAVRVDYGYMGETARRANHPLTLAALAIAIY